MRVLYRMLTQHLPENDRERVDRDLNERLPWESIEDVEDWSEDATGSDFLAAMAAFSGVGGAQVGQVGEGGEYDEVVTPPTDDEGR